MIIFKICCAVIFGRKWRHSRKIRMLRIGTLHPLHRNLNNSRKRRSPFPYLK